MTAKHCARAMVNGLRQDDGVTLRQDNGETLPQGDVMVSQLTFLEGLGCRVSLVVKVA
jgi:hypothetical protein